MQTKFSYAERVPGAAEAEHDLAHQLLKSLENEFVPFSDGAVTADSVPLVQRNRI